MSAIHCDRCEKEAPPLNIAREQGWYMSHIKSVSGIPWDLLCPECKVTDFYSEIVPRKDWNLGRFKKNPVILKSHPKPREYKLAAFCPDPKCKGNCNYQSHHLRPQQRKIK